MSLFCNPCSLGLIDRGWGGSAALHNPAEKQYLSPVLRKKTNRTCLLLITYINLQLLSDGKKILDFNGKPNTHSVSRPV